MRDWPVWKKLTAGLTAIVAITIAADFFNGIAMSDGSRAFQSVAQESLPGMQLATAFEREVLNARIHFIYHVTIQKPGELAIGWEHFEKAREILPKLHSHIAQSAGLAPLRETSDRLNTDFEQYEVSLRGILDVVAHHQNQGDAFNAMIKEWAVRGNRLVSGAGDLNEKCAALSG